jgi:hypothetical protein
MLFSFELLFSLYTYYLVEENNLLLSFTSFQEHDKQVQQLVEMRNVCILRLGDD